MSAYVVSRRTIDAIVCAAQKLDAPPLNGIDPKTQPNELGTYLLNTNIDAVNERYGENRAHEQYWYTVSAYNNVTMFGCIQCYDYQTSELHDYDKIQLPIWLKNMENQLGSRKEFEAQGLKVPWGI